MIGEMNLSTTAAAIVPPGEFDVIRITNKSTTATIYLKSTAGGGEVTATNGEPVGPGETWRAANTGAYTLGRGGVRGIAGATVAISYEYDTKRA